MEHPVGKARPEGGGGGEGQGSVKVREGKISGEASFHLM